MPLVNIDPLEDIPGGTASTKVHVVAQVYRGDKPAVRLTTDDVIIPDRLVKDLTGPGSVNLADIPVDCYWRVSVRTREQYIRREVVLPVGAGPFTFSQLVDIDPDTLMPEPGSPAESTLLASIQATQNALEAFMEHVDGDTTEITIRSDTTSNWTNGNPVLADGELGFETNLRKIKVGDGVTHWNDLGYITAGTTVLPEDIEDVIGGMITGSGYVNVVYNDSANTLVISGSNSLDSALKAGPQIIQWNGLEWVPTPPTDPTIIRYYDSTGYSSGVATPTAYNQADKWFQYPNQVPQTPNNNLLNPPPI